MANYPFKINITTKDDLKYSFYTASFATDTDTVVSASVMVDRINNMKSGSNFVDSIEAPTSLATHPSTFYGETGGISPTGNNNGIAWLSASFDHPNTGSITFTDTETAASGGLDFYTFHGTKVCSVLGLPEGIPIYTENFKLSDSSTDTTNFIAGEMVSDSISLAKGFKMSSQARMRSNLVWDDAFGEGFIQWVSGSTSKMSMGFNDERGVYNVNAPQITASNANLGTIRGTYVRLHSGVGEVDTRKIRRADNQEEIMEASTGPNKIKWNPDFKDQDHLFQSCFNGSSFVGDFDSGTAMSLNMGEGRVGINKNSSLDATLDVAGTGQFTGTLLGATISGSLLRSSGDVVAFYSSDKRLKNNIKTIDRPIYKLKQLKGVEYEWNDLQDTYPSGSKDSGIIAQDVQKVLPQLVQENSNGYLGVRHDRLVGLLVESIKEQQTQIEELKQQIEEIKNV